MVNTMDRKRLDQIQDDMAKHVDSDDVSKLTESELADYVERGEQTVTHALINAANEMKIARFELAWIGEQLRDSQKSTALLKAA